MKFVLDDHDQRQIANYREEPDALGMLAREEGGEQSVTFQVIDRAKAETFLSNLLYIMSGSEGAAERKKNFEEATGLTPTSIGVSTIEDPKMKETRTKLHHAIDELLGAKPENYFVEKRSLII